jgi:hypothetical protein
VLSSGTLSPLGTFPSELQADFPVTISAPHVVQSDQIAAYVVSTGLDGTLINSSHAYLQNAQGTLIVSLGAVFECLLPVIPDGVLFFVPSYTFLEAVVSVWRRSAIWKAIRAIKPIFYEERGSPKDVFGDYKASVKKAKGGFLIGVCNGRMAEGIDFIDAQARAVFVFGIPYPPYTDPAVAMKREWNDGPGKTGLTGRDWYDIQGFRGLFQAVGRCIRHQNDYGAIVLMDSRFDATVTQFPLWMKSSFREHIGVSDIRQQLHEFYSQMKIRYPVVMRFEAGKPIAFACKECGDLVINIPSVDTESSIAVDRKGFLELTGAGIDNQCLFVRNGTKRTFAAGILAKMEWSADDQAGYNLIVCHCGAKLGVRIKAASNEDAELIEGLWLLLSRLTEMMQSQTQELPRSPKQKKKKEDLAMKGQTKLNFSPKGA